MTRGGLPTRRGIYATDLIIAVAYARLAYALVDLLTALVVLTDAAEDASTLGERMALLYRPVIEEACRVMALWALAARVSGATALAFGLTWGLSELAVKVVAGGVVTDMLVVSSLFGTGKVAALVVTALCFHLAATAFVAYVLVSRWGSSAGRLVASFVPAAVAHHLYNSAYF